ncbi:MAG TPA: hypothetical protein VHZ07_00165 [Bryobacteraceae bacterium]|jgi:hypothetical protein|nr:hypothetical protein [Bryobacteraceae bacterium]
MSSLKFRVRLLLCGLLVAVSLGAQTTPLVTSLVTTMTSPTGVVSSPLFVTVRDQSSSLPDAGTTVIYTTDSTILFLLASQSVTDANGNASVSVIGLQPGVAHVTASVSGNRVVFTVTILDPGSSPVPLPAGIGRMVWQGSSTMAGGTPFVATVWNGGTRAAGATVNVAVTQGPAQLLNGAGAVVDGLSLVTENDGTLAFDAQFPTTGSSADDFSIITLTVENGRSAVFLVHALPPGSSPTVQIAGSGNQVFPLVDGSPSSVPVTVALTTATGAPLDGVSVAIAPGADTNASCDEPVPITGSDGTLDCHLIVTGAAGSGSLGFVLGTMAVSPSIAYRIAPASAGIVRLLSGNLQAGPSGQLLPAPLTVQVLDSFGNVIPPAPIAWQSGTATIVSANPATDTSGTASATVRIGSQPGPQTVTVGTSGLSAQFQLTDTSLGQLTPTAGNGQIAKIEQPFGKPLTVRVANLAGQPLPGRSVIFSVLSGTATLDEPVVQTGPDGTASVNVTAGPRAGAVAVEASAGGDHVDFALSALPPAALSVTVSDWNDRPSVVVPGALVTISFISAGRNGYEPVSYKAPPYPTSVQGITVSFNDIPAPILRLSGSGTMTELLVQVPWELSGNETARLLLSTGSGATTVPDLAVENFHPIILAEPAGLSRTITLPITGLGQFTPLANTNSAGISGQTIATRLSLSVDGLPLRILGITADPVLVGVADVTVSVSLGARWKLAAGDKITVKAIP